MMSIITNVELLYWIYPTSSSLEARISLPLYASGLARLFLNCSNRLLYFIVLPLIPY